MQHIVIYGFVGRDPELRYTPAGRAVADFSVAVNQGWIDRQSNARRSKTTWFKVTVWGARAEAVNSHVRKGMKVLVEGNVGVARVHGPGRPAEGHVGVVRRQRRVGEPVQRRRRGRFGDS